MERFASVTSLTTANQIDFEDSSSIKAEGEMSATAEIHQGGNIAQIRFRVKCEATGHGDQVFCLVDNSKVRTTIFLCSSKRDSCLLEDRVVYKPRRLSVLPVDHNSRSLAKEYIFSLQLSDSPRGTSL